VKLLNGIDNVVRGGLPIAEQLAINACGTPGKDDAVTLANRINSISKQRWKALQQVDTDIDLLVSLLWP